MQQQLFVALGIAAGVLQLAGYVIYVERVKDKISTGSWGIWAFGGLMDLISYAAVTTGDWVLNLLPAVCALAAIAVFGWALVKRRLDRPDMWDCGFVFADVGITGVWLCTNAFLANILFQATTLSSFIPIWRAQLSRREREDPVAWLVWAVSYCLLIGAVVTRFVRWEELVFPVSNAILHLAVAVIAIRMKPART